MKIFCIGRNYADHISELNNQKPDKPVIFLKPITALNQGQTINLPDFSKEIDYETEIVVQIGKDGKSINQKDALDHICAIGLGLDLTARDLQSYAKQNRLPWDVAKGFDGAACVGKLQKIDQKIDYQNLSFEAYLNRKLIQKANSKLMIFSIDEIISEISNYFTLQKGDLIFTGTPSGVGKLQSGDCFRAKLIDLNLEYNWQVK